MRAEFLTPANQEFLAAADFYEAQAPGLGKTSSSMSRPPSSSSPNSLTLVPEVPLARGESTYIGFPIHLCTGLKGTFCG